MAQPDLNEELDIYHHWLRKQRVPRGPVRSAWASVRFDRAMRWFAIGLIAASLVVAAFAVIAPELAARVWDAFVNALIWLIRQARQAR